MTALIRVLLAALSLVATTGSFAPSADAGSLRDSYRRYGYFRVAPPAPRVYISYAAPVVVHAPRITYRTLPYFSAGYRSYVISGPASYATPVYYRSGYRYHRRW